jgi:hypothetical protein
MINAGRRIDDLYASAWQEAIENVAKVINKRLHTNYSLREDWMILEEIAMDFGIRFDENGGII